MRALLTLAALAAMAAAVALSAQPSTRPTPGSPTETATATPTPAGTPAPPRLGGAAINRQDRVSAAHRVREARVLDSRPLLARLPMTRGGVRIDIAGLSADERATVLAIDPGQRSRAHARATYRRELRRAGDPGDAYVLEWAR